jgi:hypothetical protein
MSAPDDYARAIRLVDVVGDALELAGRCNQEATDMQKKGAFDNSNSGVLFKNDNKQSDKHADYRGEVNAAGVDYWLNGYVRTSKKGVKFIAFKLKPKQQEAAAGASEA